MKAFCENEFCENPGFKVVTVSENNAADGKRTLCVSCEMAFSMGVQHGTYIAGWKPGTPFPDVAPGRRATRTPPHLKNNAGPPRTEESRLRNKNRCGVRPVGAPAVSAQARKAGTKRRRPQP